MTRGTPAPGPARFDALVLAGGTGSRLGGVLKAEVVVAGRPMLDHVLAATGHARRVVVVGPPQLARPGVPTTLEHPPSGGPVAGIDAGLTFLDAHADPAAAGDDDVPVLVLACDVPGAARVVPAVLAALAADAGADGAQLVDEGGHAQLVAAYRRPALRAALAGFAAGGVHGVSVRRLVAGLRLVAVVDTEGHGADADTWDEVRRLDAALSVPPGARASDRPEPAGPVTGHPHADPAEETMNEPTHHAPDEPRATPHGKPLGSELHRWVVTTGESLGVDPGALDVDELLDLARDVAQGVGRPAVPLTSFLVGYGVARAGGDRAAFERVLAATGDLVRAWEVDAGADGTGSTGETAPGVSAPGTDGQRA